MQESFLAARPVASVIIEESGGLILDYIIPEGIILSVGQRVKVPMQSRHCTGLVIKVLERSNEFYDLREILGLASNEAQVTETLLDLAKWLSSYYSTPLKSMIKTIIPSTVRKDKKRGKTFKTITLSKSITPDQFKQIEKRAPKQHALLKELQKAGRALPQSALSKQSSAALNALKQKGFVTVSEESILRDPHRDEQFLTSKRLALNDEQVVALREILVATQQESSCPLLLAGVTGSGKTEVYLQAAEAVLEEGKTVLILVPEIALTPQTVRRFKSRFQERNHEVAVLHSDLSPGERHDEWLRLQSGEAAVAIGARSAVFAPLQRLGLIVVDEEHETSYKQESSPRYHARDTAVVRATMEKCPVVLGSATPSLESWNNVLKGKYRLLQLKKRADSQSMPRIRVVDMRLEAQKSRQKPLIFSDKLQAAIQNRLDEKEQTILFLNRRGYSRAAQCGSCGHAVQCPHCALALTYHHQDERMVCHLCQHQSLPPKKCPECSDPSILFAGYGTEKVEAITKQFFPTARVQRLDTDMTRRRGVLKSVLEEFRTRRIDILIGTQMIAKGLHFPSVTLVGVLNADLSLHAPDFRASERTFQLLTQVAGRAGRGDLEGEVFIQTFTPHSPSIQFARHHDYHSFAEQELEFRKAFSYPPFVHLTVLLCASQNEDLARFTLVSLHKELQRSQSRLAASSVIMGEVFPAPLAKSHDEFRFQLLLRSAHPKQMSQVINEVLTTHPTPPEVRVTCDVDAYNLS